MQEFNVIATDDGQYQVVRWNKLSQQYEPLNIAKTYPTKELAEMAARNSQEMYDEENKE